jgi:hypothetical protein
MTGSENFVLRWARLKRESGVQHGEQTLPAGEEGCAEATAAQPQGDAAVDEPFDPASLPSIETITVDTDIRAFLQSRVPADLTRAALRRAWASDPAIRDFIGIAENQWDFNDPNALHGFGPLRETDNGAALLANAIGTSESPGKILEISSSVKQAPSAVTDHEPAAGDRSVQQTVDELPSADTGISSSSKEETGADAATERDRAIAGSDPSPNRRCHGGALPR